ncbi:hypothetical protein [Streptomyces sp. NPDC052496]
MTSLAAQDPAAVERFWTAELMREAEPLPMSDYELRPGRRRERPEA